MLKFLFDENVNDQILRGLRQRGIANLVSVKEVERKETDDEEILSWAAAGGFVVVTHDVSTMMDFAWRRVVRGLSMPGVIVIPMGLPVGVAIVDLEIACIAGEADDFRDSVRFLPFK